MCRLDRMTSVIGKRSEWFGVMITTSTFTADARDYTSRIDMRIVLIDGQELAELMIDHGIGVTDIQTYTLKRIDSDYFDEE